MKVTPLALLASLSLAASGWAGEIYGTIKEGGKPVTQAVVTIKPPKTAVIEGKTDDFGNYRITVAESGKCTITVQFNGQPATGQVQSYPTPVRFDWLLEKDEKNIYSLKRQ